MADRGEALRPLHGRVLAHVDDLIELVEGADEADTVRTPVSGWSALEHAEHLALADEGSLHQLEAALDRDGGPRGNPIGRIVLRFGWIPRGVGKAPEPAQSQGMAREEIARRLREVRDRIEALGARLDEVAAARGRASHPAFGGLTPAGFRAGRTLPSPDAPAPVGPKCPAAQGG